MIKTSLSRKLIVVFSAILIAVVAFNIIINALLLSRVHQNIKIDAMEELYYSLSTRYKQGASEEGVIQIVKDTLTKENLRVFIWDDEDKLVIDSFPFSDENRQNNSSWQGTENENNSLKIPSGMIREREHNFRSNRMELFAFYQDVSEDDKLFENKDYLVFSHTNKSTYEEKNLCLRGYLSGGYKILIQMSYASIDEAGFISNTLQLIVGAVMLIIGIIIVAFTSKTIAKPVKELSQIAKSMEQLDFSKKYESDRVDEIGSLGDSINSLSNKLESTIDELYKKNKELLIDNELKSRIDIMRKEFIANASHELKTPLAIILGYAEGLKDNVAVDDESREMFTDVIIEEAEKMDHIIRQMLDLMELDSSNTLMDGREVSLSEIAEDALNSFDLILKNKNITVNCFIEDDVIVYGDYFRLYQAVTNYISNAINHVDDNRIISISVKKTGDKIRFSVYNSGANIPEEDKDNIWERFYKIDKSHTREYGGSGLGLSIVRSIVELHGGEYNFENLENGVEFYFVLTSKEISNEI